MKFFLGFCCFLIATRCNLGRFTDETFAFQKQIETFQEKCGDGNTYYHWNPYDCQKFYSCQNGIIQLQKCPANTTWNEAINSCDITNNKKCDINKAAMVILHDMGTNVQCTSLHQYIPYPYDCTKYYQCSSYKPYLLTCPSGKYWNANKNKCDLPENVDCVATSTSSSTTTNRPTTTTAATIPTPKVECTSKHQYLPYPNDCTKYYQCSNYKPYALSCPNGKYWNNVEQICDLPENVKCDQPTTTSTENPTTTNALTTNTKYSTTTPTVSTTDTADSTTEEFPSTTTEADSTITQVSTDSTEYSTTQTITATTEVVTTSSPNLICNRNYQLFPDPYDCNGYYICVNGIKVHAHCTLPLLFDPNVNGCSSKSDCSQLLSTTKAPTTNTKYLTTTKKVSTTDEADSTTKEFSSSTSESYSIITQALTSSTDDSTAQTITPTKEDGTTKSTINPNLCHRNYELFPDPYDCSGYYICVNEFKVHAHCKSPLRFDPYVNGCSSKSNCTQLLLTTRKYF